MVNYFQVYGKCISHGKNNTHILLLISRPHMIFHISDFGLNFSFFLENYWTNIYLKDKRERQYGILWETRHPKIAKGLSRKVPRNSTKGNI